MANNPIQQQATELRETLLNPDTSGILLQALLTLWKLLVQGVKLVVMLSLLLVTQVIVLWSAAFNSGRATREWTLTQATSESDASVYFGDAVVAALGGVVKWAESVRKQLTAGYDPTLLTGIETKAIAPGSADSTINTITVEKSEVPR